MAVDYDEQERLIRLVMERFGFWASLDAMGRAMGVARRQRTCDEDDIPALLEDEGYDQALRIELGRVLQLH